MPRYTVERIPTVWSEAPSDRPRFIAESRNRLGRKLPRRERLRNKVTELFYSLPDSLRNVRIPEWYPPVINVPKYLFRIRSASLSITQRIKSTLCRMYYVYMRVLVPTNTTGKVIRSFRDSSICHLLRRCPSRGPDTVLGMVFRRLKVLLSPFRVIN